MRLQRTRPIAALAALTLLSACATQSNCDYRDYLAQKNVTQLSPPAFHTAMAMAAV